MPFAPELELATVDAVTGEIAQASKHALPPGTPCPNCATPLKGAYCYACGQRGEKFNRSILHLGAEAFEGLTHLDGRIWNTVPKLIFRPGRLTRAYLDGHRASQIPPFRLFLVALLLVFFFGGMGLGGDRAHPKTPADLNLNFETLDAAAAKGDVTPKDRADFQQAIKAMKAKSAGNKSWWGARKQRIKENPEVFVMALEQWGHRFAILMLPIAALMLSVLFLFKKGVYVFDHLIFSMHSLSFQGLLVSTCFIGAIWVGWAWQLLWLAPVHLFVHMRGTYRTSVFGTLLRMTLLFFGTSIAVAFLAVALVIVGIATMH